MKYVGGIGPSNAKLAVIGEAPGSAEESSGIPFVGPSGKIVDDLLREVGTSRKEVYITNVVKIRPPNNEIRRLGELGKSISDFIPQLNSEIQSLKPNAILAFGNTALEALTGEKGIEKFRGSILYSHLNCKVIPTIHPAALLHGAEGMKDWKALTYIRWDCKRAFEQSKFPNYDPPNRNLIVCKSNLDLYRFLGRNSSKKFMACDIETFRTIPICISLAFSSDEAISVPLFNNLSLQNESGMTRTDLVQCWKDISDVLYDPGIFKIGQNFKFDQLQLTSCINGTCSFGLSVQSFYFDTMLAFRTLYPELPGSLQFIASVLTEEPYYKEEGKGYNPKKDRLDRLLLYNAKDAVVTFECYERELEELRSRGLEEFFFERVMPLHPFYMRLEGRGIRRDDFAQKFLSEKYKLSEEELRAELLTLTEGVEINVNSNGMNGQVAKYLFGVLGIPTRSGTDEKTLDALMRNTVKDPRKRRIIELILEIRKVRKVQGTYIHAKPHPDGRLRTGVRIMLETGRTSTSVLKPPVTTQPMGLAFQTLTKPDDDDEKVGHDIRSMFVPDEGYVFLEPDLSSAEDRIVMVLSRDKNAELLFKYKIDRHRVTAGWIYDRAPNELLNEFFLHPSEELAKQINEILKGCIDESERQLGKKSRHSANYDVQKRTFGMTANISEWRAGKVLDKVHQTNPNIRGVFHKEIREFLNENNRILTNPFGRVRQFLNKWGEDLFKEGYAQIPQSTVSDHLKFAAQRTEKRAPWLIIVEESHDSFLSQCPLMIGSQYPFSRVDCTIPIMKEELEVPIDFSKCSLGSGELIIPAEFKIGKNWEMMEKIA